MELKILSLNVRVWTKCLDPFKWNEFILPRLIRMRRLFHREDPDIICLQERMYPLGKFLLGLRKYTEYGDKDCRLPIFVKNNIKGSRVDIFNFVSFGGKDADNGHGISIFQFVALDAPYPLVLNIQNCHYSWETDKLKGELYYGFYDGTIFCGDMNTDRQKFLSNLRQYTSLGGPIVLYDKTPVGPTYISYDEPIKYRGDIDQFGFIGKLPPKAEVTILPDKVSDHFPILAKITI